MNTTNTTMTKHWIWTFRYNDNDELAILVAKKAFKQKHPDVMTADVTKLVRAIKLIEENREFRPVGNFSTTEWETWLAFELCPAIEIYYLGNLDDIDRALRWRTLET